MINPGYKDGKVFNPSYYEGFFRGRTNGEQYIDIEDPRYPDNIDDYRKGYAEGIQARKECDMKVLLSKGKILNIY